MRTVVNRLLALIVSLVLIALAVVIIVEVIAYNAGSNPVLIHWPAAYAWAQRTTWNTSAVLGIGILLTIAGLALIIFELWRTAVRRLPIDTGDSATDAAITRRGLARDVTTTVSTIDGVTDQHVTVGRRHIAVRAASAPDTDRAALTDTIRTHVRERLDRLQLRRPPQVAVTVTRSPR